jgi:release factor glutamine methyltransferase
MHITTARKLITEQCQHLYDPAELQAIVWKILEHLSGKAKLNLLLEKDLQLQAEKVQQIIDELKRNKPIQYILGYEWFGNLKLKVTADVLIPRPETEELVRLFIDQIKKTGLNTCSLIDIGTGSGCIPILIRKELPEARVSAMDISEQALLIAAENAQVHQADIHFVKADIRDPNLNLQTQFDFIISNPPYILPEEKQDMHPRVYDQEPSLALFVTAHDPLEFYKAILNFAKTHLKKDGAVYFEINQQYGPDIQSLCEQFQYHCDILKDMYGNPRFAIAHPL